ncbi:MAG: hypothetical protein E7349_08245, partial [Clostridiales bacterium]|nr:hypothetical protein [Clostridiales bacterium]
VLMLCYILFWLVCYFSRRKKSRFIYGILLLILWGYILLSRLWQFPFCYQKDGEGIFNFFLGCLIAEFWQGSNVSLNKKKWIAIAGLVLSVAFFIASYFEGFERLAGDSRYVLSLLVCPSILLNCVLWPISDIILGNRVMRALGKLSTSIFYWHMPLYMVTYFIIYRRGRFFNDSSNWVRMAVYFAVLFVGCCVAYLLFEKLLGSFLSKKLTKRTSGSIEVSKEKIETIEEETAKAE